MRLELPETNETRRGTCLEQMSARNNSLPKPEPTDAARVTLYAYAILLALSLLLEHPLPLAIAP